MPTHVKTKEARHIRIPFKDTFDVNYAKTYNMTFLSSLRLLSKKHD